MADSEREHRTSIWGLIIKFVVNGLVLLLVGFLTPGFSVAGFWPAVFAAIFITVVDYFVQMGFGIDASPTGRGISGFIVAAIIIYVTQFFIPGVSASIWGAVIAALVIGILDAILPQDIF